MAVDREFFVSFTGADRPWAVWLLAELDAAGYSSVSQLRDFVAGNNFAVEMDRAARRARRTLGVLSPKALQAPYVRQEWAQRLTQDPTGELRALILMRVEPCEPEGFLRPVVHIDLVGLDEATARARLREELAAALRGERHLAGTPDFPGSGLAAVTDVKRPRFPTALPPVWNVPYRRNPTFTGREKVLTELAEQLGRGAATTVTQALQGGGGVGKTAVATEYAYRHRSEFDMVWWVRAEEPASLVGDYATLAGALRLSQAVEADQQGAAMAVRRWLEANDRWLLVLDNAQGPDAPTGLVAPLARVVDLLPRVLQGQVLITSRDASWEEHAELTELEVFTPEEALAFLLARSGSGDHATAAKAAELLGLLPLALEQAGAYVRETRLPLVGYLERLQRFPKLTVAKGRPRDRDPADTVATTWQVSLERVQPVPGAVALLEVCAFLNPESIPRDLIAVQLDPPAAELAVLGEDPFVLDEAVAALRRFGLLKADEQTLTVHRLLQQVVRDRLDRAAARDRVGTAVWLLAEAFPKEKLQDPEGLQDPEAWPICAQLLPHTMAAAEHAEHYQTELAATSELLDAAACYLHGRARYVEARALAERALALAEVAFGPGHETTAVRRDNLGTVLHAQGELNAARALHQRALSINEARLGSDHPETARSLNNLASVMHAQGDLGLARVLHERALSIREAHLGSNHPTTSWSLHNLATLLHAQGDDLNRARAFHRRALSIRESRLGLDHPTVAHSLHGLALVLRDLGDLQAARNLFERAISIRESRLGRDHPDTAWSLNGLALVLRDLGDLQAARNLFERAISIHETRLGRDHPWTPRSLSNLAGVLREQGDLDAARDLLERALAITEARLGANHPNTAHDLSNLAGVLREQGDLDAARDLLERALAITEARLGADHPETVRNRKALAAVRGHPKSQQ